MLSFVKYCQTALQSVCVISHSHQQWMRVPVVLIPADSWCCQCFGFLLS